jgi:NAD+ diphosphatase
VTGPGTAAVARFELLGPPVLSRSAVPRDESLRRDVARQRAGWPTARLVVVDEAGRTPVEWTGRPPEGPWGMDTDGTAHLVTMPTTGDTPPADAVLLGEADGTAYWAVRQHGELVPGEDPTTLADLRTAGAALDALGAGLLTTAVAALNWHDAARFCGRDGSPTRPEAAGWHRVCAAHGHEDYPRTDPAVICLVHDGADRVLLARQPVWPEGRFSVLAGFVEAGESLEACVLREIHEEVGVPVRDVAYLGSQAWPFPRSLMVGFQAVADADVALHPAQGEIAEAMWVTRTELRAALAAGDWAGAEGVLRLPGAVSIARAMLEAWAAAG